MDSSTVDPQPQQQQPSQPQPQPHQSQSHQQQQHHHHNPPQQQQHHNHHHQPRHQQPRSHNNHNSHSHNHHHHHQQQQQLHHHHPPPQQQHQQQQQPNLHHPHQQQPQHHPHQQQAGLHHNPHQQPQQHHQPPQQHHHQQQQPPTHPQQHHPHPQYHHPQAGIHHHAQSQQSQPHHHPQQAPQGPGGIHNPHPTTQQQQPQPAPTQQHQQHTPQVSQQQQAPPPHHIAQQQAPPPHSLIMNQQYPPPNMIYTPIGPQFVPRASHLPHYEHSPASHPSGHPADPVNLNSPQPPASINNHHLGTMPMQQMQAVISTTTTGANNVNPINSGGSMMEAHMTRPSLFLHQPPFNPNPYMSPNPYMMSHYAHINMHGYPAPIPATPALMPLRVPGELGNRPPFDPQNPTHPVPAAKAPLVPGMRPLLGGPMPQPPATAGIPIPVAPITPIKPREKKALAIVDPVTKHVFSEAELKDTPTTPQSQASRDSTSTVNRISSQESGVSTGKEASNNSDVVVRMTGDQEPSDKPPNEKLAEQTPQSEFPPQSIVQEPVAGGFKYAEVQVSNVEPEKDKTVQLQPVLSKENGRTESREKEDEIVLSEGLDSVKISIKEKTNDISGLEKSGATDAPKEEESPKKPPPPKLPYEEGQYSPVNKTGRKKYSIEFLKAVCKEMGLLLPQQNPGSGPPYDFKPAYCVNQSYRESSAQPLMRRSSQQVINKPRKIIPTHSLQQEVELNTAEKPWKPELDAQKPDVTQGEIDTKRLLKVFRGHLNKLTPQKYDSIIEKIEALDLDGPERLASVIDLVFDKAVDEPGFCELYARMCKVIATKDQQFSLHLVKKCQDEFETSDLYDGLRVEERKIGIELEQDASKRKLMSEELYEEMRLRRKKYLGTIKLIGEMYKLNLLAAKIIGLCMNHLVGEPTNENIECLCSLIGTVGLKMSHEAEDIRFYLKSTLDNLKEFVHSKRAPELALESRIKFKILDTIDLQRRNWKPRMVENNPKKIDDIREEVELSRAKEESMKNHHHNHTNQPKPLLKQSDDRNRRPLGPPKHDRKW